jgi:hypothetical protein
LDGLTRTLELHFFRHRLVNRASALRLIRFHSPSVSSQSVALFQLNHYGLGKVALHRNRDNVACVDSS